MVGDDDVARDSQDKKITLICNEGLWQIRVNVDFQRERDETGEIRLREDRT